MLLGTLALAAGCLIGLAAGGRLSNLGRRRLRGAGLLVAGSALEFAGDRWGSGWSGLGVILAGFVALFAFALANLRVTGMVLVAAGILSNLAVIGLDRGMPVRGVPPGYTYGPRHHGQRPGDHLVGLDDAIRVPILGDWVSAGDVVLSLGAATVMVSLMGAPGSRVPLRTVVARRQRSAGGASR
jgi:hypothetical protein